MVVIFKKTQIHFTLKLLKEGSMFALNLINLTKDSRRFLYAGSAPASAVRINAAVQLL